MWEMKRWVKRVEWECGCVVRLPLGNAANFLGEGQAPENMFTYREGDKMEEEESLDCNTNSLYR
jgi:hypothetical protein